MPDLRTRIVDVDPSNVDDALRVCTFPSVKDDESLREGCEIRRRWLMDLYRTIGPCAKLAYVKDNPVGVIQFTPLHVVPYLRTKRKDALYIHCIFVPKRYRNRGIGSALLDSLTDEMSRPNRFFLQVPCRMLVASANEVHGYTQVGLFRHKGFRRTKGSVDVGLVLPLRGSLKGTGLDIPSSRPRTVKEHGVKIFYKPTCQYCTRTNREIEAEIRKINKGIPIEECNLWTCAQEAIRRRITYVATYVNGKPLLPMPPRKFLRNLKQAALQAKAEP
jgi:GNAT superfamily N-acetyltransferase